MTHKNQNIRQYLLANISKNTSGIVAEASNHFKVTRTTIHRHLNVLIKQNKIIKSGTTKQIKYFLNTTKNIMLSFSIKKDLSESVIWQGNLRPIFEGVSENVRNILHYGATEIINNAIDHSQGNSLKISLDWSDNIILLQIQDNGMGVFERIKKTFGFRDEKECLLHLSKGKLTTDPLRHSGEGIFFTSRLFDKFTLRSNGIIFHRDNLIQDWTFEETKTANGTVIVMEIDISSKKKIVDVFNQYTELEDFSFCKTDILVDLSLLADENLISRSQAKRILERLESFTHITLDFSKIKSVGQGFVDEIFRVYRLKNPQVEIHYIHANSAVAFMIQRGLPK